MLVRPFIQPISAFDVTNANGIAKICVLGGDTITTIYYQIFQSDTGIYGDSVSVTDNGGSAIREFSIELTQAMGLVNDSSYTMRVWTANASETSGYSSVALFSCYTTPTITLKDSNNTTITTGYTFTAQSGDITVLFDTNSSGSPALLNTFNINIYGLDANQNSILVYSSGETYTPFVVPFDNLTPTTVLSPLYSSYTLDWTATTTQGMGLSDSITGIACDYTITESGDLIRAENDGGNGRIKVSFTISGGDFGVAQAVVTEANNLLCAVNDDENVYFGGGRGNAGIFIIYDKVTKQYSDLIVNPITTRIDSMAMDNNYVYCGGSAGQFAIYNKATHSFGELVSNPIATASGGIEAICCDENYVYCGGYILSGTTGFDSAFAIYDKSSRQFGALVPSPIFEISTYRRSYISEMVMDENNIYCCSEIINNRSGEFVVYNKSTGTFGNVMSAPFQIASLGVDGSYVYLGSATGQLATYNKVNTFSRAIQTALSYINHIETDNTFVYLGGGSSQLLMYSKLENTFGDVINSGLQVFRGFTVDYNNVYGFGSRYVAIFGRPLISIRRTNLTDDKAPVTLIYGLGRDLVNSMSAVNVFFYDNYAKANCVYQYSIVSSLFGTDTVQAVQVLSQFCKAYIANIDKSFELYEEWNVGSYQRNQKSAIYEPYSSKYPLVAYNAVTNYTNGSDTALYRAEINVGQQYIDNVAQAKYNKELSDFLTNRKTKVRKTSDGDIALVAVVDSVPNNYDQEMGNILANTTFKWVEVGDFTDSDFKRLGITNSFTLYTI